MFAQQYSYMLNSISFACWYSILRFSWVKNKFRSSANKTNLAISLIITISLTKIIKSRGLIRSLVEHRTLILISCFLSLRRRHIVVYLLGNWSEDCEDFLVYRNVQVYVIGCHVSLCQMPLKSLRICLGYDASYLLIHIRSQQHLLGHELLSVFCENHIDYYWINYFYRRSQKFVDVLAVRKFFKIQITLK